MENVIYSFSSLHSQIQLTPDQNQLEFFILAFNESQTRAGLGLESFSYYFVISWET